MPAPIRENAKADDIKKHNQAMSTYENAYKKGKINLDQQ